MIWIYILAFVALICAIIALVNRDSKPNALSVALSSVALVVAFAALAIAAPRNLTPCNLTVDYLGIIVAILAAFATLLLAMQLYNVFSVKEDAQKALEAKNSITESAEKVKKIEEQYCALQEMINTLQINNTDLHEKNNSIEQQYKALQKKIDDLGLHITENPEWIYVMTDAKDHILFGIKHDGSVEWSLGIPKPIENELMKLWDKIQQLEKLTLQAHLCSADKPSA